MNMNHKAMALCDQAAALAKEMRIEVTHTPEGTRLIDFGAKAKGSIKAGLLLGEICMGGLGNATVGPSHLSEWHGPAIQVTTCHPVQACLGAQYAGWKIQKGNFFAMGSGPMRAAYAKEDIFQHLQCQEQATVAVGVLESSALPGADVIRMICEKLQLSANCLTLCVAATTSQAGGAQIAARSVETALHQLHELRFPIHSILEGIGWAPLPPIAPDFLQAIGRTNDAILYGGLVHLFVDCEDSAILETGSKAASNNSPDYGAPFSEIFSRARGDFYKIDPKLFAPAKIVFHNRRSGKVFSFGQLNPGLLNQSWA